MTSTIQIKRKIVANGGGAPSAGAEGELALNFKLGTPGGKPQLWANGGATIGWCEVNPDSAVTVGSIALPGGTAGSPSGIAAAWTALAAKPTTSLVIANFAGTAYIKTGSANVDADWTPLGAATSFATQAEVDAGTDAGKALNSLTLRGTSRNAPSASATAPAAADANHLVRLNAAGAVDDKLIQKASAADVLAGTAATSFITPAGLGSRTIKTPSATPANDHDKIPVLDATGKIAAGFLPIGGLVFSGTIDPTAAAYAAPTPAPTNGQFFSVSKAGAISPAWKPYFANAGLTTVAVGDYMVWDATASKFHHVANVVDMSAYIPLAGSNTITGNLVWGGAAANKKGTIIFSGKSGTIDDVTIDCGQF